MKNPKTKIISLILLSLAATLALAKDKGGGEALRDRDDHRCHGEGGRSCVSAPEIDPGQAIGALTLLGGTLAIVRGYRRGKKKK